MRAHEFSLAAALGVALGLSGCVGLKAIPFDRGAAASIHSVVLIGPQEPKLYPAVGQGAVVGAALGSAVGGAVGGAIAGAGTASGPNVDFNTEMQSLNLNMGQAVRSAIAQALTNDGYQVSEATVVHPAADLISNYDNVEQKADGILDAAIMVAGYAGSRANQSSFAPLLIVLVRMVDTKSHKIIFTQGYTYSPDSTVAVSDARFTFEDGKVLLSNPQLAADGLRTGVPMLAMLIQRDLAK